MSVEGPATRKDHRLNHRIAIVTDSTANLSPEAQCEYGIAVIPLNVHFGQDALREGVEVSADAFQARVAASDTLPTTSQPSVSAFEAAFRSLAAAHDEILCVLQSSKFSGTVRTARLAADAVKGIAPVTVVDSLNVSSALGFQAIRAAGLAAAGMSLRDIVSTLMDEIEHHHIVFFVETLEHLRRGGRVGKGAQVVGSLLQLRPLLRVEEGQVVPFERSRTRSKATAALVEFVRDLDDIEQIAVLYNTTPSDAEALAASLGELLAIGPIPIVNVGPVISTHVGPGVLGIAVKEASNA